MTIKRYNLNKDNTISSAYKSDLTTLSTTSNMGSSDILEVFSIYAHASSASLEQSRILASFSLNGIISDTLAGNIPASGSRSFILRLFNAPHGQTTPDKYHIGVYPILKAWDEGSGLDMESYVDQEASNWLSSSKGIRWNNPGSDYASPEIVNSTMTEYKTYISTGPEDMEIDVTPLVETWIKSEINQATASIVFPWPSSPPPEGSTLVVRTSDGQKATFLFTGESGSIGEIYNVATGSAGHVNATSSHAVAGNLFDAMTGAFSALSSGSSGAFGDKMRISLDRTYEDALNRCRLILTQVTGGFYGNTKIEFSSSLHPVGVFVDNGYLEVDSHFTGGLGASNHGFVIKLSGSSEDGSTNRSYYTKKFFARSSQFFFKKPTLEVRWDESVKDDRHAFHIAKDYYSSDINNNSVYLYNRVGSSMQDFPTSKKPYFVKLHEKLGTPPVKLYDSKASASVAKVATGVYEASFGYSGTASFLYDVWAMGTGALGTVSYITGSGIKIVNTAENNSFSIPNYRLNITNLKSSYGKNERITLRVHTRDKEWQPNIYTVATLDSPVNNIKDMYYKIVRTIDNLEIIGYSTASAPKYSQLSYDKDGSYFSLDMSLLEPNYSYEISFLYKDAQDYTELGDKFKFRVK